jgi:hypothetical protein
MVELPWAADGCPWVGKLRTVLPLTVGIRDGAVQLVSTLGSVVISARAELGSIITWSRWGAVSERVPRIVHAGWAMLYQSSHQF